MGLPSRELTYPYISPSQCIFEDDFPFLKVGYVSSLEGKWDEMADEGKQTNFQDDLVGIWRRPRPQATGRSCIKRIPKLQC